MIAIKGTTTPKQCYDCVLISSDGLYCRATQKDVDWSNIHDDCPLIEIVTCSECKHLEVINGAKIYAHCPMWEIDFEPFEDDTRTNYCSWGKRRADDSN